MATASNTTGDTGISAYFEQTEFGTPRSSNSTNPARYGWLGSERRSYDSLAGLTLMGARLYNPTTGRFLQVDPVPGGCMNAYVYVNNPVDQFDLDGRKCPGILKSASSTLSGADYLRAGNHALHGEFSEAVLNVRSGLIGDLPRTAHDLGVGVYRPKARHGSLVRRATGAAARITSKLFTLPAAALATLVDYVCNPVDGGRPSLPGKFNGKLGVY